MGYRMENTDIGVRLRYVRLARNISQRKLAERAGVTPSTISLIEAGRSNPSVGALKRILDGIPIDLGEFFSLKPEMPAKFFYKADELTEIGKGKVSYRQIGERFPDRALQILKERYQPGSGTGKVLLVHKGEEGGIVISGRLEVIVDNDRRILGPGDAYYFESKRPHGFRCVGDAICEVVSACTPPTF